MTLFKLSADQLESEVRRRRLGALGYSVSGVQADASVAAKMADLTAVKGGVDIFVANEGIDR